MILVVVIMVVVVVDVVVFFVFVVVIIIIIIIITIIIIIIVVVVPLHVHAAQLWYFIHTFDISPTLCNPKHGLPVMFGERWCPFPFCPGWSRIEIASSCNISL